MAMMGGINAATASEALALLAALSDPATSKAVLQEIQDKLAKVETARGEVNKRADELNAQSADLAMREGQLTLSKNNFDASVEMANLSLTNREAAVSRAEDTFNADSKAKADLLSAAAEGVKNREKAVAILEGKLAVRESEVAARELAVAPLEAAANAVKAEYETKLAAMKAITG